MNLKRLVQILKGDRELKAKFHHFCGGSLYYEVALDGDVYLFEIEATPEEVGTTDFNAEIRAASLLRYIRKALEKDELIKMRKVLNFL